jgi:hypothetical protein
MAKTGYPCRAERGIDSCAGCECEQPALDPVNYDIWYLWGAISTQWRTVVGENLVYLGLDYTAVYKVAKTLDIEITPAVLSKLQLLENSWIMKKNKKGG